MRTDWSAEYFDYETFKGVRLPTRGTAIWHLPEGPMPYVRLRVTELEFVSAGKPVRKGRTGGLTFSPDKEVGTKFDELVKSHFPLPWWEGIKERGKITHR